MKKMFLMVVATMMATMMFAQAYEWKILSSAKPEDFVNVSEQEGKDAANKLGQYCIYSSEGDFCWFTSGSDRTHDSWSTISSIMEYGYTFYYPAAAPVPEAIDLGLSVKWANFNIGASKPEAYGDYFAWGETAIKDVYSSETYTYTDNPEVLPLTADAAHVIWGGDWRMPTTAECQELLDNCTWLWTTQNGADGYLVTSNVNGYTDKSIFLPAAGEFFNNELTSLNIACKYWSSSRSDNSHGVILFGTIEEPQLFDNARKFGISIRPVLGSHIAPTAIDNTNANANINKTIVNGQLIIIRDGVRYNAMGQVVE